LGIAFPSFRTRGDYLAIVTLAFNMIIKSVLENVEAIGGPRGFMGMEKLTSLWWVYLVVILMVFLARNYVFSNFGRGVLSIREDEIASGLVSVNTRQVKVLTFVFSAFLAGIAGGLFAHELQFINPRSFTIHIHRYAGDGLSGWHWQSGRIDPWSHCLYRCDGGLRSVLNR
jgi:branched-chain amino acid transport system permease protein